MNFLMEFRSAEDVDPDVVSALEQAGHHYRDFWITSYLSDEENWATAFQRGLSQIAPYNLPIIYISIEDETCKPIESTMSHASING